MRGKDAVTNFPHSEVSGGGEVEDKASVGQLAKAAPAGTSIPSLKIDIYIPSRKKHRWCLELLHARDSHPDCS